MLEMPLVLAVLGHVNAGKTALIRMLGRQAGFGEVDAAPGSTRSVAALTRRWPATVPVRFDDTPGFEDPVALMERLQALPPGVTGVDRLWAWLDRPEARVEFEPEAAALRALLAADAVVWVIDTREWVLPKFHAELSLLASCGKPVLVVLNHVRSPASRRESWLKLLDGHGLMLRADVDVMQPSPGAEGLFFHRLASLLSSRRPEVARLVAAVEEEAAVRRQAALMVMAQRLLRVAALRRSLSRSELADDLQRQARLAEVRQQVLAQARQAHHELMAAHGFQAAVAAAGPSPELGGHWEEDLLQAEALKISAGRFGAGAVLGAAVGLGVDAALMGASMGAGAATGAAVGAALGGTANQASAPLGRAVVNLVSGSKDVWVEEPVLLSLLGHWLALHAAFAQRSHADSRELLVPAAMSLDEAAVTSVLQAVAPARHHADWAVDDGDAKGRQRAAAVLSAVLARLDGLQDAPGAMPQAVGRTGASDEPAER